MNIKIIRFAGEAVLAMALLLPSVGLGQVVIGDWDDMTDQGWIDYETGISIADSAVSNMYSFGPGFVDTGSMAVQVDLDGWGRSLELDLGTVGQITNFLENALIQFDIQVPAGTAGGGYAQFLMRLNSDMTGEIELTDVISVDGDHNGFAGDAVNFYFWEGSAARKVTVTVSYGSLLAAIGEAPSYVQLILQSNCAPETNSVASTYQIDNVMLLPAPLIPGSVYPDNNISKELLPTISAAYTHGSDAVDTNNITMTLDGETVAHDYSFDSTNSISTISYTPAEPFEQFSVHTAKVVVASTPGGTLYTNEWSFEVVSTENITYLDASDATIVMATSPDGPVGTGTAFVFNTSDSADGIWRERPYGVHAGTTSIPTNDIPVGEPPATVLESTAFSGVDNCPRLKVSATDLDDGTYNVYVYFWHSEGGAQWPLRAGLEDTPGTNSLTEVTTDGYTVAYDEGGRELKQVYLGMVSGTQVDVYVEDRPAGGNGDRTWFDGIGYEPTVQVGPTVNPDIQSFGVSDGTATLTWASEDGITYSILHKTNLTDSAWTPAKTGISSEGTNTTDSVNLSGEGQEFFSIEGN